jgi:hypothetical protein
MVQLACYGHEMKRLYVFVLAVITLLVLSTSCGHPNGDERLLLPEPSSIPHLHIESKTNLSGGYQLEKDYYRMIGDDSLPRGEMSLYAIVYPDIQNAKQFFRRKLHISVDSNTHEIRAVVFSKLSLDDAGVVKDTLDQITEPIEQLDADGAYDKRQEYDACDERGDKSPTPRG